jgi:hypothetical protein
MRRGFVLVGLLAPVLLGAAAAAAAPAPDFRISDARIGEASGIATGIRSPGVAYVENDSGDRARFFALDAASGTLLAEFDVPGVTAVDWEDIAVAPDADGTPSVWLADIGDNMRQRSQVQLYRVDEPKVDRSRHDVTASAGRPDVWRLRYPSGPADAESLAVSPRGVPYVVTKSLDGRSTVYAAPPTPNAAVVHTLRRVGAIAFSFTGTPGPYTPIGELTATGANLSRDGKWFVVRTYTDAYLWPVAGGDLAAALRSTPTRLALPRQPQGEGICFDGAALLIDSEGADSPVYRVPVPELASRPSVPPSTSAPPTTAAPPASVVQQPPSTPTADAESTPANNTLTYVLAAIAAAVIAAVGLAELMRRRRT